MFPLNIISQALKAPGVMGGARNARAILTALLSDGNTALWCRPGIGVTGTLNVSNWENYFYPGTRDLAQATGANQPINLPHTGTNYGWFPNAASNVFSTPDAAINQITGDIDIRGHVALDDYTKAGSNSQIISKYLGLTGSGSQAWTLGIAPPGFIRAVFITTVGGTIVFSTAAPTLVDGTSYWIRVTRAVSTGNVTFYTSTNGTDWTQVGAVVVLDAGASLVPGNRALLIGNFTLAGGEPLNGKVYRAQVYNGINGTLAVDFNAADWSETTTNGATKVSSTTGETWTLNNTGAKPAQIVGSPQILADGAAHFLQTAAFTLPAPYCVIAVEKAFSWTSGDVSFDGRTANSFAAQQFTGTPQMRMKDGVTQTTGISPTLNTYNIISASQTAGGAVSLQLNNETPVTATGFAATAMAGFTAFADGAGANFWNGQKKDLIVLTEVPSAAKLLKIKQLLGQIHGVSL